MDGCNKLAAECSSFCHKPDDIKVLCSRDREEETRGLGQEATANAEHPKTIEELRSD